MKPTIHSASYPYRYTAPALLLYSVFCVLPFLLGCVFVFTNWNVYHLFSPRFVGFDNFVSIFADEHFFLSLGNTLWFTVVTSVLKIVFGLALALVLTRSFPGRGLLRSLFFLPSVLSIVVIGITFTGILKMDGVLNSALAAVGLTGALDVNWLGDPTTALGSAMLVEVWRWSGFVMIIFIAGLQGIPQEYYEAGQIDGVGSVGAFFHITVPLLLPAFTVATTLNLIGGLKVFEQVYVLTNGGPGFSSQVLTTYIFQTFLEGTLGRSTAISLLFFIVVSVLSLVVNGVFRRKEIEA